ncbi:MAG: nitroreductase [Prosthecobacter sp.]|uniref:nitroreductase family protein n=1 Tax=Prosthecobacter sp. TaxID=1965333 RepID=UPI003904308D
MTDIATHSQLSALIRHRRSIKPVDMDSSRMVERSLLMQVLEDATWAPTHGLTEPWKFVVHQGAGRARLAEAMQRIYRETSPPQEFREDKMKKMGVNPLIAPVVIAGVMVRRGGVKIPEVEEIEAVACALQNLMLSATAAGLGCYWSTPPLLATQQFAEWLQIGPEDRCMALIYLGWPREGLKWPQSSREPVESKTRWCDV